MNMTHVTQQLSEQLINKYKDAVLVIKFGGSIMEDQQAITSFVEDIVYLRHKGIKPVIVHGGGKEINRRLDKQKIESQFLDGYRVTTEAAMEEIEMVLKGKVNNLLVTALSKEDIHAVGLSGKDMSLLKVSKKPSSVKGKDYGYVGDIKRVNNKILSLMIDHDIVPVIAPIGHCDNFETYNINADDVACAVGASLKADSLVLLTDVNGLYTDFEDKNSIINKCDVPYLESLIDGQTLAGAILPKVSSCITAIKNGVDHCHIINGSTDHSILLKLFGKENFGTTIIMEDSINDY